MRYAANFLKHTKPIYKLAKQFIEVLSLSLSHSHSLALLWIFFKSISLLSYFISVKRQSSSCYCHTVYHIHSKVVIHLDIILFPPIEMNRIRCAFAASIDIILAYKTHNRRQKKVCIYSKWCSKWKQKKKNKHLNSFSFFFISMKKCSLHSR